MTTTHSKNVSSAWNFRLGLTVFFLLLSHSLARQDTGVLQSLRSLEALRLTLTNENRTRTFNLDVVGKGTGEEIALCNLIEMNRHSVVVGGGRRITFPTKFPLEALAAVSLALEHLNTGNGQVVKEVEGLPDRCNVRFVSEFVDTAGRENQAVDRVIEILERDETENLPCGFIGAFRSPASVATSILTGIKGYPQFSGLSTSTQLSDKSIFPLFGRVIPTANLYAIPLLDFLYNRLGLRHLAVLHTDNTNGLSQIDGIRQIAADIFPDFEIRAFAYRDEILEDEWEGPITAVRQTGFRYIYVISAANQIAAMIQEAYKQGISGNGEFNWIFSNAIGAATDLGSLMPPDSPLHLSGTGALTFSTVGMLPGVGRVDAFEKAWKELSNEDDLAYLQTKVPQYPGVPTYDPQFSPAIFSSMLPFTPLFYDLTIALGLGACGQSTPANSSVYLDGPAHYANTLKTSFVGASGKVAFNPQTGDRNASTALYVMENLVPRAAVDENGVETGNYSLIPVRVAYYDDGEWVEQGEIVFNDGTSEIARDLPRWRMDYNYLSPGLRAAGLVMAGVIVATSVFLSIWTHRHRTSRTVRASQPIFLHLLCLGTLLIGASIIPLSFDDNVTSDGGCDIACMAFPWLLALGFCISASALFTKTHRVNRIFHNPSFKRVTVTIADVVKPMAIFITLTVLILSLWSVIDPMKWTRTVTSYDRFGRPNASRGYCTADHALAFAIPLAVTNFGVLLFAMYEAYVARKISTEFAESEYIARAMVIVLVLGFLGIPIVFLCKDDFRVFFFVVSAIIFIGTMSLLGLIFIPKMVYHKKKTKDSRATVIAGSVENRTSINRNDTTSMTNRDSSMSESSEVGAKVVEHPKLKEESNAKIKQLTTENKSLRKRVGELETLFEDCEDDSSLLARYNEIKNSSVTFTEVPGDASENQTSSQKTEE